MDYGIFKALQGLLFFGAVFAFGLWQLASLRRSRGTPARKGPDHQGARGGALNPAATPRSDPSQGAEVPDR